jgi:hypothetical protein
LMLGLMRYQSSPVALVAVLVGIGVGHYDSVLLRRPRGHPFLSLVLAVIGVALNAAASFAVGLPIAYARSSRVAPSLAPVIFSSHDTVK